MFAPLQDGAGERKENGAAAAAAAAASRAQRIGSRSNDPVLGKTIDENEVRRVSYCIGRERDRADMKVYPVSGCGSFGFLAHSCFFRVSHDPLTSKVEQAEGGLCFAAFFCCGRHSQPLCRVSVGQQSQQRAPAEKNLP